MAMDERLQAMTGSLYLWKIFLLIVVVISVIFIFRSFCRFICPLGAFYSFFHKVSIVGMKIDEEKCNHCNACVIQCKMDVKQVGDRECIQCGECMEHCRQCALTFGKK